MWVLVLASLLSPLLFGQEKEKKPEPCSLLTAADAANILGATMPRFDRTKNSCTYGALGGGVTGFGRALDRSVTLRLKTYKSAETRDKEWAKALHDPDNKKDAQPLGEIGDDAFLVGSSKDGKIVGTLANIWVRKGLVLFSLMIWDKNEASSADAAIAVAKRIANEL